MKLPTKTFLLQKDLQVSRNEETLKANGKFLVFDLEAFIAHTKNTRPT